MADEHLAYGEPPGNYQEGSERGMVTDTFRKIQKSEGFGSLLSKLGDAVERVNDKLENRHLSRPALVPTSASQQGSHRFGSFAAPCEGNDVKWYVDGASYFFAVSLALERARDSIWILDCTYRYVDLGALADFFEGGSHQSSTCVARRQRMSSTAWIVCCRLRPSVA